MSEIGLILIIVIAWGTYLKDSSIVHSVAKKKRWYFKGIKPREYISFAIAFSATVAAFVAYFSQQSVVSKQEQASIQLEKATTSLDSIMREVEIVSSGLDTIAAKNDSILIDIDSVMLNVDSSLLVYSQLRKSLVLTKNELEEVNEERRKLNGSEAPDVRVVNIPKIDSTTGDSTIWILRQEIENFGKRVAVDVRVGLGLFVSDKDFSPDSQPMCSRLRYIEQGRIMPSNTVSLELENTILGNVADPRFCTSNNIIVLIHFSYGDPLSTTRKTDSVCFFYERNKRQWTLIEKDGFTGKASEEYLKLESFVD